MLVQRYTRPITIDDKSLNLEVLKDNRWDGAAFALRFPLRNYGEAAPDQCEAEQYAHHLINRNGITDSIRITPSSDPVTHQFVGGIGNKHLEPI